MKALKWVGIIFMLALNLPAHAFTSVDEQIDHYLEILNDGTYETKIEMLQRLQWSGLTAPRLFDEVEKNVFEGYLDLNRDKKGFGLLTHHIRALGYSGNEKYRDTLEFISNSEDKNSRRIRGHSKKALVQLGKYKNWNRMIAESDIAVEGKSVEVVTYMKMLNVTDFFVQRQAARATYDELRQDPDLLDLIAFRLESVYLLKYLDKQGQDTAAWFCKALGQNGGQKYTDLLTKVAADSPHSKIKKYASKYTH
jgi:hypothetical protein